ncbi:unnamed protein product [Sphagnum compactum]
MRQESSNQYDTLSVIDPLSQHTNVSQKGSTFYHARNHKGSTKGGNIQAYALGAGQSNNGTERRDQHKQQRADQARHNTCFSASVSHLAALSRLQLSTALSTSTTLPKLGPRAVALKTYAPQDMYDLTISLDSGCVGGHLLTTPGSYGLLSARKPTINHYMHGVTGNAKTEYEDYLPMPGVVFNADFSTTNLISLNLWERQDIRYVNNEDTLPVQRLLHVHLQKPLGGGTPLAPLGR